MTRLNFILSLFKLVNIRSLGTFHTSFDYFDKMYLESYFFHNSYHQDFKTQFKKKDVNKLKNTIDFIIKNYRYTLSNNLHDDRLGTAIRNYRRGINDLGFFHSQTTPYAVKVINGLLVADRSDSKDKFVTRTLIFLRYLGIRNKNTKKILQYAYDWRSNDGHGTPIEKTKREIEKKLKLTPLYIELFMLNCARLLLFTLVVLKKNSGKELTALIDNTNTVNGIKKLNSELRKTKKYFSVYREGIKIKEGRYLDAEILECLAKNTYNHAMFYIENRTFENTEFTEPGILQKSTEMKQGEEPTYDETEPANQRLISDNLEILK